MNIIDKIALDLKLDSFYLQRIAKRSSFYYRDYKIPKHTGGERLISQPSPELKTMQYWVLNNIIDELPVSNAAYAYKKGDSIKKHANLHCNSKFVLHADICNFFPSIHSKHLNQVLENNKKIFTELGIDYEDALNDIQNICFRNDSLCIGAVSSPAISNVIMYSFDVALLNYCKSKNCIYSRYADDIYISSKKYIDTYLINVIQSELYKLDFSINRRKTKFFSSKYRRKITGLIITGDSQVSVGTERRNEIKKMVYDKLIHGKGNPDQILGYLSFLKDVEPLTYDSIIIKYSKYCNGDIIEELSKF